ncbi:MAG: outer membrane beta-barrel family protein, partial [Duncaniella sp.]|nr:outer membrane beta-barrel family protein [Duncaniella sp.]
MSRFNRLLILLLFLSFVTVTSRADNELTLWGRVKTALTKSDLPEAMVLWPDSTGEKTDTIRCDKFTFTQSDGTKYHPSYFVVDVPRVDSLYVFEVICDGYRPQTVTYRVDKLKKRENQREMPVVFMERAPHQLKEVTVTASKIKFYNKGDTIVFNADAFQLAEGSMLDGLISQLPGVELNDDGQIRVNGEFVESLLLNGKEFFDGNNQLMLDNIAAYTVKNVEVYKGQTRQEKLKGEDKDTRHLIMDVQLKKEYNGGWVANAQVGAGTHGRYSGRLFARWFSEVHSLTLIGNINNLNDNRRPGRADTWTPDMMPDGTRSYRMAAAEYSYSNAEETADADASIVFEQLRTNEFTTSSVTNFFDTGNTYENRFTRSKTTDTKVESKVNLYSRTSKYYGYLNLSGLYRKKEERSNDLSATFDTEQKDVDMEAIETIYTEADPERLKAVINRAVTRTDGTSRRIDLRATPGGSLKFGADRLSLETYIRYNSEKEERWNDYTINYGADPTPAVRRRQYFDNSPNYLLTSVSNLSYAMNFDNLYVRLNYEYRFSDHQKDSYMYALDRLADMGMFGTLPAGYLDALDPANSYTSRSIQNRHSIEPTLQYIKDFKNKSTLMLLISPSFRFNHDHLSYWRAGRSQLVRQSDFLVAAGSYDCLARFYFTPEDSLGRRMKNSIEYQLQVSPTTADPYDRLDVINDADPLNIYVGNPDLVTAYSLNHRFRYNFNPSTAAHPISEIVEFSLVNDYNALTKGYLYDTSTGVRTTRTYNVDGNRVLTLSNTFRLQFGRKNQFTFSSNTYGSLQRYADMIGVNLSAPQRSIVDTRTLSEKLDFAWQIGNQTLTARTVLTARRSTSDREDFSTINARHFSYGLIGNFKLPAGFA